MEAVILSNKVLNYDLHLCSRKLQIYNFKNVHDLISSKYWRLEKQGNGTPSPGGHPLQPWVVSVTATALDVRLTLWRAGQPYSPESRRLPEQNQPRHTVPGAKTSLLLLLSKQWSESSFTPTAYPWSHQHLAEKHVFLISPSDRAFQSAQQNSVAWQWGVKNC